MAKTYEEQLKRVLRQPLLELDVPRPSSALAQGSVPATSDTTSDKPKITLAQMQERAAREFLAKAS